MMWSTVRDNWHRFHQSFHYSAVIWIARGQVVIGAVWLGLTSVDLAPLIGNPKYVTAWLVFSGIVTEIGRRSNTFVDPNGQLMPIPRDLSATVIVAAPPAAPASPVPTSGTTK